MPEPNLTGLFIEVAKLTEETSLHEDALLWKEGDPGDSVVLLVSGSLVVTHDTPEGETVVLRNLYAGSVVGEIAAFDGRPRSATIRARENCRILRLPATEFRTLLRRRTDILEQLFVLQLDRVRSLTGQVTGTHHRAITDPLTGIYNFGFFRQRLEMEIDRARQTGDHISLIMFDIDHFKQYNDTHGHQEGNIVLVELAAILKKAARRVDIVARYGGEEFVAMLYGAGRDEALRFAENARRHVETHAFKGEESQPLGRLTVSVGLATFPIDSPSDDGLIRAADRNLYRAKEAGRNRVVVEAVTH
jgi:diguanylate cyclase (GGDEF)-like protein